MTSQFPDNFIFGAATSSFQIEGNHLADGASESNWFRFCHQELGYSYRELQAGGCDHYNRWNEDVQLINALGLNSYRFSTAWPRIISEPGSSPNSKGISFYDKLIDELLSYDISPMLTLFHWDLPQTIEEKGGWANPNSVTWFEDYVNAIARKLSDRDIKWITMNEPWVFLHLGLVKGVHAPGIRNIEHAAAAYKNILLAQSRAVQILRSYNSDSEIGISCNISSFFPKSDSSKDIEACRRLDEYHNRLFLDPWLLGEIPDIAGKAFGEFNPDWKTTKIKELDEPIDFVGINYYTFYRIEFDSAAFLQARSTSPEHPFTEMKWEIYPKGIYEAVEWIYDRYKTDIYITENGCAFTDDFVNGEINDIRRISYMYNHLSECARAIENGYPLKGYYAWSLLDNFEWTFGLNKRFGLIHVDFNTKKRTIKNSGYFYRDFINGFIPHSEYLSEHNHESTFNEEFLYSDINFRAF